MAAFLEQEGLLSSPTWADECGRTVRTRREARQLRYHATVIFGAAGEWAVEIANDGPPLTGLYVVRAEPDAGPLSATARTFADPLSGLPTLAVELSPYHPPIALHLALLIEYSDELYDAYLNPDTPPYVYRLYPPPTMVMSPRSLSMADEAATLGRQSFATWPWPKTTDMSVDTPSLPPVPALPAIAIM